MKPKAVIALSGGVDSTVSALLLKILILKVGFPEIIKMKKLSTVVRI